MSHLAKLNLKTVHRNNQKDPVVARRDKLVAAIEEQGKVLAAALNGDDYIVQTKRWKTNNAGERVRVEHNKHVRAWFFEQDKGFYVQCRYGSRILNINGKSNAVFVDKLEDVADVLKAFNLAAESSELDDTLTKLATRRKK